MVSIIIINYNTFDFTCQCINSVKKNTIDLSYEIIVIDNASTECNPEKFKDLFPKINLIKNDNNEGFARGNNIGIKQAKGNYILLLNSDTLLKENSIKITFDYLENHPDAAVVSPRLTFPNGKHQSCCQRFPSIRYKLFELLRLQKLFSKRRAGRILLGSFFNHNENIEADWVWGTFFMFRKSLLELLPDNKLNDEYFMYYEDMQWCMDFKKLGYKIHYCADTEVIHLMGGSSGNKIELMKENNKIFLQRNYNFIHRSIINFLDYLLKK